jgi:hypothetical protein
LFVWTAELCDSETKDLDASLCAVGLAELAPPAVAASNKNKTATIDGTRDGLP